MTWITVVITPLIMVLDSVYGQDVYFEKLSWLVWLNDISWCVEIVLNFFVTSDLDRDLPSIARSYLKGFFIFDVLATLPPMITN